MRSKSFLEVVSVFLAAALPVGQFFFGLLPQSLTNLFLGKEFFLPTSVVAAVLCFLIWLLLNQYPYFRIAWNWKKHWTYERAKQNFYTRQAQAAPGTSGPVHNLPEGPVIFWTLQNTQLPALLIAFSAALAFIFVGILYHGQVKVPALAVFGQLVAYCIWVASCFVMLVSYTVKKSGEADYDAQKQQRVQTAINAAIELNSFENFPRVRYLGIEEGNYPLEFIVYVEVELNGNKTRYRIGCDSKGEVIRWVLPESEIERVENEQSSSS